MISLTLRHLTVGALWIAVAAAAASGAKPSGSALRALEDNGYQYLDDLSGYQMQFGKCVRVKVPEDDDEEGNSYFYNGHYYAQGLQYASVYLCDSYSAGDDDDGANTCGVCDTSKEYVTDLGTYLETTLGYAATMCNSCNAQCGRRRRRRLEEGGEDGGEQAYMNVDCNTCVNQCKNMNFDYNNGNGDDEEDNNNGNNNNANSAYETYYLECQEAFEDENGVAIYAGPQCNSDGDIVIGFYYDDECTVKSSSASFDLNFDYGTFRGLQNMCLGCNAYGNGEDDVCYELYQASTHCSNGNNLAGDDDEMPICSTYKKAHKEKFYGQRKKKWRVLEYTLGFVIVGGLIGGFLALSYTYFLRHRAASGKKEPLMNERDHHSEPEVNVTSKTDLPQVS